MRDKQKYREKQRENERNTERERERERESPRLLICFTATSFADDDGATLTLSKGQYNGEDFHIPSHWGDNMPNILDQAKDFSWNEDDVWICSFPKSGQCILALRHTLL